MCSAQYLSVQSPKQHQLFIHNTHISFEISCASSSIVNNDFIFFINSLFKLFIFYVYINYIPLLFFHFSPAIRTIICHFAILRFCHASGTIWIITIRINNPPSLARFIFFIINHIIITSIIP